MEMVHEHEVNCAITRELGAKAQRVFEEALEFIVGHLAARHREFCVTCSAAAGCGTSQHLFVVGRVRYAAIDQTLANDAR